MMNRRWLFAQDVMVAVKQRRGTTQQPTPARCVKGQVSVLQVRNNERNSYVFEKDMAQDNA